MRIHGVWPSTLTPFDDGLNVDLTVFERHVRRLADAGVQGLVVVSTLGEAPALSLGEKRALIECAAAVTRPRGIPLVATLVGSGRAEDRTLLGALRELGADALLLFPPALVRLGAGELVEYVRMAIAESGLPTVVFNKPSIFGCDFSPEVAGRLAGEPGWAGVKEAAELTGRIPEWKTAFGDRCAVLSGDEFAWEALGLGADGFVAGLGNAVPAECVAFYEAFAQGRLAQALALYRRLAPLFQLDVSRSLVQNIKVATAVRFDFPEVVRPPRGGLDEAARLQVRQRVSQMLSSAR